MKNIDKTINELNKPKCSLAGKTTIPGLSVCNLSLPAENRHNTNLTLKLALFKQYTDISTKIDF